MVEKGGGHNPAFGISRGGRTTKIHALVDVLGRLLRLILTAVIPGRRNRKILHDDQRYRDRLWIEAIFCRAKYFRRVATRYDKLALSYLSAVPLAAVVAFWTWMILDLNKRNINTLSDELNTDNITE